MLFLHGGPPSACCPLIVSAGESAFGHESPSPPQLLASKIKQTFLSTNLAFLLAFEQKAAGPYFRLQYLQTAFHFKTTAACPVLGSLRLEGGEVRAFRFLQSKGKVGEPSSPRTGGPILRTGSRALPALPVTGDLSEQGRVPLSWAWGSGRIGLLWGLAV